MNRIGRFKWSLIAVGLLVAGAVLAQDYQRRSSGYDRSGYQRYGGRSRSSDNRNGVPLWEKSEEFEHDVFTFVRIQYDSYGGGWGRRGGKWRTDYPDADLNLSFRLKQLTSLEVDPNGLIIRLTDEELFDHPFIYIIEPGDLEFSEDEVVALRKYLNKGGFLMVDDFWGEHEWRNFYLQMKRVFPDREPEEVPLEHEIFHIVYDLKEKPQIPSIGHFLNGMVTERSDAEVPHYRGIFDDDGRMMAFICHNTDLGDGWEREGEDRGYFQTYSEPFAYPLGINIVTYALTH